MDFIVLDLDAASTNLARPESRNDHSHRIIPRGSRAPSEGDQGVKDMPREAAGVDRLDRRLSLLFGHGRGSSSIPRALIAARVAAMSGRLILFTALRN